MLCAYICAAGVRASVENFTVFLGAQVRYEGEQEVTALDWQELENRNASDLTQMQGVISTDAIELPVIWKACLWKMNLFGH